MQVQTIGEMNMEGKIEQEQSGTQDAKIKLEVKLTATEKNTRKSRPNQEKKKESPGNTKIKTQHFPHLL